VVSIVALAGSWSIGCMAASFVENPYGTSKTCENHEERALTTLVALLATMISLKSNPPKADR
jgi:hypothetical protein